jgi:hypothetical protein
MVALAEFARIQRPKTCSQNWHGRGIIGSAPLYAVSVTASSHRFPNDGSPIRCRLAARSPQKSLWLVPIFSPNFPLSIQAENSKPRNVYETSSLLECCTQSFVEMAITSLSWRRLSGLEAGTRSKLCTCRQWSSPSPPRSTISEPLAARQQYGVVTVAKRQSDIASPAIDRPIVVLVARPSLGRKRRYKLQTS